MKVEPYLMFEGRCAEALAFYRSALGATVTTLMHFKDNPDPAGAPGCPDGSGAGPSPDMVMHAEFSVGETTVMASDGMGSGRTQFQGISLALSAASADEATRLFNALADGGQVQMPLAKTFFSQAFGMVADRFGVPWMVIAPE
jgi:PhnB protein